MDGFLGMFQSHSRMSLFSSSILACSVRAFMITLVFQWLPWFTHFLPIEMYTPKPFGSLPEIGGRPTTTCLNAFTMFSVATHLRQRVWLLFILCMYRYPSSVLFFLSFFTKHATFCINRFFLVFAIYLYGTGFPLGILIKITLFWNSYIKILYFLSWSHCF